MANDYFNHSSTLTKHTLARAAQVNSVFESIAAGLDKLPGADPLNQGRVTYVSDTGAADAYVVSLSKAPSSYTAGLSIVMKAANTNTGASTIDVNSLGVKNIKRYDGTDLVANDILASALIHLVYDGTAFRIVGANGAESALAKEWASKTGGTVDGSEHSAKSWAQETGGNAPTAGSAKEWATETSTVDGGLKGARGYAQDASSSASAAATSETNAESHYDTFRGVFYGPLSSDPSTDPNGDALDAGDWYFNTTTGTARQYDGSVWKDLGAATLNTFVFTASGGETSLSGADDNGNTLTYTVDFIQVHRNGALLTPDDDYTGSDGSSITGLPAAIAGDVYVIDAFSNLSLANVYTKDEIDEWDPEHATGTDTYVSAENTSPPGTGKTTVRDFQNANTGSTPTLDGRTITDIDGNALWAGALNRVHTLLDDGTNYRVVNPIPNTAVGTDAIAYVDRYPAKSITDGGTDAFTVDLGGDLSAGDVFWCKVTSANTTSSPTLENTGGAPSGAKNLVDVWGNAWSGMLANRAHWFRWDGTNFIVLDPRDLQNVWIAEKTGTATITTSTWTDISGLSITLTPDSVDDEFLVTASVVCGASAEAGVPHFRIVRDSGTVLQGDAAGSRFQALFSGGLEISDGNAVSASGKVLSSPGTTSSTTFKVQWRRRSTATDTGYLNRSSADSDSAGVGRWASTLHVEKVRKRT